MADAVFRKISPSCGVEVFGVDLRCEPSENLRQALREAWRREGLLLFRGQDLADNEIERTASLFGAITHESYYGKQPPFVSNVVPDGLVPNGELGFHNDKPFTKNPLRGLLLYAYEAPPEGAGGE